MPENKKIRHDAWSGLIFSDSLCATLFITGLFLPQLTENPQYQWVNKYQAAPGEAEAALNHISSEVHYTFRRATKNS